jgi:hypothetical protein
VTRWNADASNTHTVALNRFADLSDDEYRSVVLLPKSEHVTRRRVQALSSATRAHVAGANALPASVDWRLKSAVAPVKDQVSVMGEACACVCVCV